MTVNLMDMEFHCTECDENFDRDFAADLLAQWEHVLKWVAMAPVAE